ncbi:uncharacterized protein LOC144601568 [Rhinoraja longicauda]
MMTFQLLILTFGQLSQGTEYLPPGIETELPRPTITLMPDRVFVNGESARIDCRCPGQYTGSTVYLKQFHKLMDEVKQTLTHDEDTATFNFTKISSESHGSYQCFYKTYISGRWMTSQLSKRVEFVVQDEESSEKPNLPVNIWTWVAFVAGGVIMVILTITVAWCIYRKVLKSRRDSMNRSNFWTSLARTDTISNRQSFRFSRNTENLRENGEEDIYYANQSSEYLKESPDRENGSNSKPYFITFRE